jgi:hypothetical protein
VKDDGGQVAVDLVDDLFPRGSLSKSGKALKKSVSEGKKNT